MPSAYPPDIWYFAGINLQNDTLRVRAIDGYSAVPPMRGTGFVRSAIPGEMFRGKIHGARVIGLELLLFSHDIDPLLIHQNLDMLAKAFNTQYQTEQALTQYHPDSTVRTAQAHCVGWNPKSTEDHIGALYIGIAEFLMSDPYFYTPVEGFSAHAPGSGIIVTNHGTVRTHKIVFTFHSVSGGISNPTVTNNTNGLTFTLHYVDIAAHNIVVNCTAFTAVVDVTNFIGALTHSGDFPFMVLEPGDNDLTVSGCDDFDIAYYSAYI